jgi:hypothetical protein
VDITPEERGRLDRLMDARRLDLGLTWREVAARGGLSYESLREIRTGPGGTRTLTMRKIDAALEWLPGSVERTLNGGEPQNDPLTYAERTGSEAFIGEIREGRAKVRAREEAEREGRNGKGISALGG